MGLIPKDANICSPLKYVSRMYFHMIYNGVGKMLFLNCLKKDGKNLLINFEAIFYNREKHILRLWIKKKLGFKSNKKLFINKRHKIQKGIKKNTCRSLLDIIY